MRNLTFLRGGGGEGSGPKGVGWPVFINFYFNYNCWSYENVEFLISSKSSRGRYSFRRPQEGLRNYFKKSLIQNGGLHPYKKFQHSSSISKCSKIGGTELNFEGGGFQVSQCAVGVEFQKSPIAKILTNCQNFRIHLYQNYLTFRMNEIFLPTGSTY